VTPATNTTADSESRPQIEAAGGDPPGAWISFIRGHAGIVRELDATMRAGHGLNLNEYEVLLQLWLVDRHRLRRVDLAQRLLITQGGITRLLAGLERAGLVERIPSTEDARVVYAELTAEGTRRLESARRDHLTDVERLFSCLFTQAELATLEALLSRLHEREGDDSC
jgi:DNA-binding MarR family transcriptional regulator